MPEPAATTCIDNVPHFWGRVNCMNCGAPREHPESPDDHPDPEHYAAAVQAWDDAYADRNGLPRFDWEAMRAAQGAGSGPCLVDEDGGVCGSDDCPRCG